MSDSQSEIEAIARATYEAYGGRFGAWDLLPEWSRKERRKYAEAIHDAVAPAIAERGREELLTSLLSQCHARTYAVPLLTMALIQRADTNPQSNEAYSCHHCGFYGLDQPMAHAPGCPKFVQDTPVLAGHPCDFAMPHPPHEWFSPLSHPKRLGCPGREPT